MVRRGITYLNPIAHLGDRKYSYLFPIISVFAVYALSELVAKMLIIPSEPYGMYVILISIIAIIYSSFRNGIRGGVIATLLTSAYYLFIIHSRNYTGQEYSSGVNTTIVLTILYLLMAGIIGWLKQTIDLLIDQEANERRRLQAIVQQLPVGIIITDSKGKVVQTNKLLDAILGSKIPIGHIMGKDDVLVKSLRAEKPITPSQSPIAQALASGRAVVGKEFIIDKEGGKKTFVQVNASPIRNRTNVVFAAASIITDITTQKEIEKRKDDFVNMASHELKTPITSLKLYTELLKRQLKKYHNKDITKTIRNIESQTQRLTSLVSDLLDVSRLQTGKLAFTKETFRIDELVVETVNELQAMAKDQRIVIKKILPITLSADRFRIYQVITNLITNAIKYSDTNTDINVAITRKGKDVIVSVQDFGIGIAKDQQKKIFERLYQVSDSSEKSFPGLGLGLYITKEIVKKHKGTIWVDSEKGKGSKFSFSLPIK
jgi:two-component system phosphate regulon sensor histidine kinase PhoR